MAEYRFSLAVHADSPEEARHRARQNVLFEYGYFLGALRRTSGRVILLHKGRCELPSDITGIVPIDITAGVEAAGVQIQNEVRSWLPWLI